MRAVLGLVSALAFTACAQAGPPTGGASGAMPRLSAMDTIEICLSGQRLEGDMTMCIYRYADQCLSLPGEDGAPADRGRCHMQELLAWGRIQAVALGELEAGLPPARWRELEHVDEAWSIAVGEICHFQAGFHEDEDPAGEENIVCLVRQTALRTIQLIEWKRDFLPD